MPNGAPFFYGNFSKGGPGFATPPPPPNRSIGVLEEKFSEILEHSEFVWHGCATVQWAASSAMRQTRNSPNFCAKRRYPASHQYGLQIAEGMVTFFESYERELEKYWTKTLFFQFS